MLLTLLLLAVPDPETAIDAERAFNRAAQTEGQWTAFRKFATDEAIIFTPQPVAAKDALPEKDPPVAVQWAPAESYVSCDGTMAINTGHWSLPNSAGYFTTVWVRQADGHFKWTVDGGDTLVTPRVVPKKPKIRHASCSGTPSETVLLPTPGAVHDFGRSADGTLAYYWAVKSDGSRVFDANLWNGRRWEVGVVRDRIAAPK